MERKKNRNRKDIPDTEQAPLPSIEAKQKITELLDIPASAVNSIPQIEISGNREAIVEGCQGVMEYDENVVKLSTGQMSIRFTGRNLQIRVLTHSSAVVHGFISNIEFIS